MVTLWKKSANINWKNKDQNIKNYVKADGAQLHSCADFETWTLYQYFLFNLSVQISYEQYQEYSDCGWP